MHDYVFREYDIRGAVGTEFQLKQVYDLGCAIAYYFLYQNAAVKTVAIGMDGRVHSAYIKSELTRALQDSGLNVIFVGLCPTPVLYFSLHTLPVDAGLMVTASHNGKEYNGIKLCLGKESIWGSQITAIKELYKSKKYHKAMLQGSYKEYPMVERYTDWIVSQFSHLKNSSLPMAIDCANGATAVVIPELVKKMKWSNVKLLYETLDGNFPHHSPDPVVDENMNALRETIKEVDAAFGMAFDGDGDRMVAVTKSGKIVSGDKLLALYAQNILKSNPGTSVVFDIKCSSTLPELLTRWGGKPYIAPSGHSIIKHEMKKKKALLGGELSCHFFFGDRYFGYDDGIYASLRLCELVHENKSLEQMLSIFPSSFSTPEIRIDCDEEMRGRVIESTQNFFAARRDAQLCTIDGVRATLPYGWGLVRFSNTQPAICLRFESSTQQGLEQVKEDFYNVLKDHVDSSKLKRSLLAHE